MIKWLKILSDLLKITVGCALFGLGFNLFLAPADLNAGGISGLSMVIVELMKFGTIGWVTMIINLPLFAIGGLKIGKGFFFNSLFVIFSLLISSYYTLIL